ncbi:hypothetical protein N431DRAFT_227799 [Stipitochalara longipes BDJ]|nr:hypothetical protein N431DRAFT_227799 [Stipitochalara longipes BDJ]
MGLVVFSLMRNAVDIVVVMSIPIITQPTTPSPPCCHRKNSRMHQNISTNAIIKLSFSAPHSHRTIMSAMDIAQAMDEATLRRSPRRRSPDKPTVLDTAMKGAVPRSKSPSRTSPDRTSRSRSPIMKAQTQPITNSSRLNLLSGSLPEQNQQLVSQNSSNFVSAETMDFAADKRQDGSNLNFPNATKPTNWAAPTKSFQQPHVKQRRTRTIRPTKLAHLSLAFSYISPNTNNLAGLRTLRPTHHLEIASSHIQPLPIPIKNSFRPSK